MYDVTIVGGGPAGLSAALALGRARRKVALFDSGPRRNQAAVHIHNFVTRDGTTPDEFRRVAREQLATYPNVELRSDTIGEITGTRGSFRANGVTAKRVLLATGMIDDMLPLPGFRELWGQSIFQCPYCHGWEIQDRHWGYLPLPQVAEHAIPFALQARAWSDHVVVFGQYLDEASRRAIANAGIPVHASPVVKLVGDRERGLQAAELADDTRVQVDVLFAHPTQQQVPVVRQLVDSHKLVIDEGGFVQVDAMKRETSIAGIYAAGDLTTRMQGAILAAAQGAQTASMINVDLALDGLTMPKH
jgi:thioredoxin reductase